MDAYTRFPVVSVVPDTGTEFAIAVLDSHWISQFWNPTAIQFDQAFYNEPFHDYLEVFGIEYRPIPARRHNKDVLESKHKVIGDMSLRLSSDGGVIDSKIIAQQPIRISNDLYWTDVCSSFELAKEFTRPLETGQLPKIVPEDLLNARDTIMAKRKLNLILQSKCKRIPQFKLVILFKFSSSHSLKNVENGLTPNQFSIMANRLESLKFLARMVGKSKPLSNMSALP